MQNLGGQTECIMGNWKIVNWYSRTVKRLLTYDLTLKTSTGTMVLRFLKRGYPRSDNIAVDRYHNGPLRELGPPLIMPTMLWIGTHLP